MISKRKHWQIVVKDIYTGRLITNPRLISKKEAVEWVGFINQFTLGYRAMCEPISEPKFTNTELSSAQLLQQFEQHS